MEYPILEFDPSESAVIRPEMIVQPAAIASHCVVCFFKEVIDKITREHPARLVNIHKSEMGDHPVYEIEIEGKPLAFYHPGVGAPLVAALFEEVIAMGCRKFIAVGGAGVLDRDIQCGKIVVPVSAVRDEGVSYHYLPPSREVSPSTEGVSAIEEVLSAHKIDYIKGKTWTTDAIYRETIGKINKRKEEGCLTAEMEAAAFFAVASFRKVSFAQMLYGGDDVSCEEWDHRNWIKQADVREKMFWLAAEACLKL